ncbi:MAG: DNA polymerase I [Geminicoccaceae bacterium]
MSDAPAKSLVLIDGSGYIFRAFFALPPMTRPDGTPVNAVFGFANMLFKLMQDRPHDDLVVVFDYSGESFRNQLYDQYKANRDEPPKELVPQFQLVRDAARAFGLPVIDVEGYEADDLIAAYAKLARDAGEPVTIVSSDKDLMQLVADGIVMWDPMKQKAIGRAEVIERFGVGPELVCDALSLIGDTSDNVPGVPGIGPKNAAQLLTEFGSLEGVLANLDQIKQPKRREVLAANAEKARLSYRLVCLAHDAPVPHALDELRRKPFDAQTLLQFLHANGFKSLAARIGEVAAAAESNRSERTEKGEQRAVGIATLEELDALLARATELGLLAIDTETTSLDVARAEMVGVCLAVESGEGFYIPLGHVDEFGQPRPGQLDRMAVVERLRPVLADPSVLKIGHNIKYDAGILAHYGLEVTPTDDTMLLSYVLGGASHGHGMDELAQRFLDHDCITYESLCGKGAAQIGFAQVPVDKATAYAAEDAEVTLRLWRHLRPRLLEERMVAVYESLDRPLSPIVTRMERTGIRVDAQHLRRLSAEFTQRMAGLQDEAYKLAGRSFNLGSPKQLGEVLFDELSLGGQGRKTKTGAYATGAEVLEELALAGHELPRVILDWRQLQKLTRTYTDTLVEQVNPTTGRVHTSYSLAATSTGRLSSNDPNLQNIPIRTEEGRKIREAFVPEDGHLLVSADYSQIELRILADMADIAPLKQAFANDVDIHRVTASQMFGIPVAEVGPDLRRSAKTINYGIVYGISTFGLAQRLGIPQAQAKAYIDSYFEQYPGIRAYMDRAKAEAREKGFVRTLWGRRCYIPEINVKLPSRRAYAERAAINAPIQGSAADIMKRAMIHTWRDLERNLPEVRMLLQVHDELVFEVPEAQVADAQALIRRTMERAAAMSVPLVVEVGHGASWEKAH